METNNFTYIVTDGNDTGNGDVFTLDNKAAYIAIRTIYYIVALVILVLNGLTLAAIAKFKNLKNGTNYLICSLSLADLSLGVALPICAAFTCLEASCGVCKVCFFFISSSLSVSLTTIVAIALERFYAVVYPLKHKVHMNKKLVLVGILGIWLLEMSLVLINFLTYGSKACHMFAMSNWISLLIVLHVGFYMIISSVVYTKMYFVAVEHMHRVHGLKFAALQSSMVSGLSSSDSRKSRSTTMSSLCNSSQADDAGNQATVTSKILVGSEKLETEQDEIKLKPDNHGNHHHSNKPCQLKLSCKSKCDDCVNIRVARMTFLVLVVMVMCWLPFLISNVIKFTSSNSPSRWQQWMFEVSMVILYCNSFMNPLLYSWQISEFRQAFKRLLCNA